MDPLKKNKCSAWAKSSNKRCTKNSLWNSKYCWQHQSKIPIIIVLIIGIITSLIIPKFWERCFPSAELKTIENNTDALPKMANDIKDIKVMMSELQTEKKAEFNSDYPAGYELFGIVNKKIIPSLKSSSEEIKMSWASAKIINITKDSVTLMLPDVTFPGGIRFSGNIVGIKNKEGATSIGAISCNDWYSIIKIIKSDKSKIIAVLGYRKGSS